MDALTPTARKMLTEDEMASLNQSLAYRGWLPLGPDESEVMDRALLRVLRRRRFQTAMQIISVVASCAAFLSLIPFAVDFNPALLMPWLTISLFAVATVSCILGCVTIRDSHKANLTSIAFWAISDSKAKVKARL